MRAVHARTLAAMGWLSDFFRLVGGFLYWNARKTFYRLRGARGRCPCQHPSDSGNAWETGCNAITHWNQPARFQSICPLLQKDSSDRWRCSVNQADVRPFWGRAFAFYGTGFAALYLAGTLAAFTALRTIGYPVTYAGIIWPPSWSKFDGIKSDFFLTKFQRAYAAQDTREAMLDLSLAYDLNPRNYSAGFLLAQLCQVGQSGLSDRLYRRLLAEHPENAEQTSQAFFRSLLARGDFQAVQALARDRILTAPDFSPAWLNAFLFANRRIGDDESLAKLAENPRIQMLPPDVQTVLSLACAIRTSPPSGVRQLLLDAAGRGANGYTLYFICNQLIQHDAAQAALGLVEQAGINLSPRDRTSLRLNALAARDWATTLDKEVGRLLAPPLTPAVVELLSTHLILWPDDGLLGKLFVRLKASPLPPDEKSYSAYLTFFCAAGVARDKDILDWSTARLKEVVGTRFSSLDMVGGFFLVPNNTSHLENYLPTLQPLPLETTYALFTHYAPVANAPRSP
ncbi:MAG TPA: hypothetical protein VL357_09750 [Rariglobus sp.]|jgi:hypothetical protein|nr:hypothetical protein [Rariglobus sp.]